MTSAAERVPAAAAAGASAAPAPQPQPKKPLVTPSGDAHEVAPLIGDCGPTGGGGGSGCDSSAPAPMSFSRFTTNVMLGYGGTSHSTNCTANCLAVAVAAGLIVAAIFNLQGSLNNVTTGAIFVGGAAFTAILFTYKAHNANKVRDGVEKPWKSLVGLVWALALPAIVGGALGMSGVISNSTLPWLGLAPFALLAIACPIALCLSNRTQVTKETKKERVMNRLAGLSPAELALELANELITDKTLTAAHRDIVMELSNDINGKKVVVNLPRVLRSVMAIIVSKLKDEDRPASLQKLDPADSVYNTLYTQTVMQSLAEMNEAASKSHEVAAVNLGDDNTLLTTKLVRLSEASENHPVRMILDGLRSAHPSIEEIILTLQVMQRAQDEAAAKAATSGSTESVDDKKSS